MSPFAYARAPGVAAAVASGARHGSNGVREPGADFLAGGTDMVQLMAEHLRTPGRVVDVSALPGLDQVEVTGDGVRIGALVRMADAARHPGLLQDYAVLPQALLASASASVRNLATLGGNVLQRTRCGYFRDAGAPCNKREPGTGCPALGGRNRDHAVLGTSPHCIATYMSDYAHALAALDATVRIAGPSGERAVRFIDLHRLHRTTRRGCRDASSRPGRAHPRLSTCRPCRARLAVSHYLKVRDRAAATSGPSASAAVVLDLGDDLEVHDARIAIGGVATRPWRLPGVEAELRGRRLTPALCRSAAAGAAEGAVTHGDNAHKPELIRRAVARALALAGGLA